MVDTLRAFLPRSDPIQSKENLEMEVIVIVQLVAFFGLSHLVGKRFVDRILILKSRI